MYTCTEGSLVRYKINELLSRFIEAGIIDLIYDEAKMYFLNNLEKNMQRNVTIENSKSSFCFLLEEAL